MLLLLSPDWVLLFSSILGSVAVDFKSLDFRAAGLRLLTGGDEEVNSGSVWTGLGCRPRLRRKLPTLVWTKTGLLVCGGYHGHVHVHPFVSVRVCAAVLLEDFHPTQSQSTSF